MSDRRMDLETLAHELVAAKAPMDATEQRVAVALLRLLAEGVPVPRARLAEHVGLPSAQVATILAGWPWVFFDDQQRVLAFWGLALRETPHHFDVGGRRLYTWCAWDTLFLPPLLGTTAQVASSCPVTGETIRLTVGPEGVTAVSPPTAVLSFLRPEGRFDEHVIQSFCHFLLFFASETAVRTWTATHPGTFVLSIDEGLTLGRLRNEGTFGLALGSTPQWSGSAIGGRPTANAPEGTAGCRCGV
jgi:alkylmercury lyase